MHALVLLSHLLLFTPITPPTQTLDVSQFPAQTRLIPFRTLTLSDRQFLNGDEHGTAELRREKVGCLL